MRQAATKKLYTLHAVLRGRVLDGTYEVSGRTLRFNFIPSRVAVVDQRLVMTGRMGFEIPQQPVQYFENVKATLMATQGGIGVSPVRRQLLTGTAQTAQTATSDQKLEQEKGPETELQPGLHSFEPPKYDELGRPKVESTDALSFVGVLYFRLAPLDASAWAIPLDMSAVQLGARLAPTDDLARDIQVVFSDIIIGMDEKSPNQQLVNTSIESLNRILVS